MGRATVRQGEFGAGPFVTLRLQPDGVWRARSHRKGLHGHRVTQSIWQSRGFNMLMAVGFAIGSACFIVGSALSLSPRTTHALNLSDNQVSLVFFLGSIFFTTAAYFQLLQAANVPPHPGELVSKTGVRLLGWRPFDPGWLASALQFVGTLLFNLNTFDAMQGGGNWLSQDVAIWAPDMLGSAFFLTSSYLALVETCHNWGSWRTRELAWWIVIVNFIGCVAFMASAVLAYTPQSGAITQMVTFSVVFTLVGAMGFLQGAVLALFESPVVTD
jgi:hypothetical protein